MLERKIMYHIQISYAGFMLGIAVSKLFNNVFIYLFEFESHIKAEIRK